MLPVPHASFRYSRRHELHPFKRIEEEIPFDPGIFIAVAAMNGIFSYRCRIQLADRALVSLGGVGCADQLAEIGYGIVFLQDGRHDGAAAHEFDQLAVKRPGFMDGIEFTGRLFGQTGQFHGYDAKAAFKDLIDDGAGVSFGKGVRFDHCECAIAHIPFFLTGESIFFGGQS